MYLDMFVIHLFVNPQVDLYMEEFGNFLLWVLNPHPHPLAVEYTYLGSFMHDKDLIQTL